MILTARQTTHLEEKNRREKRWFQRKVLIHLPPRRLESGDSQEEGGSVPSDLVKAIEFLRNSGDGGGNNCLLLVRYIPLHHQMGL